MITAAERVIFCLDHSKFGRRLVSFLCPLDEIDVVVTDRLAPEPLLAGLRERGIEVVRTPETAPR